MEGEGLEPVHATSVYTASQVTPHIIYMTIHAIMALNTKCIATLTSHYLIMSMECIGYVNQFAHVTALPSAKIIEYVYFLL